MNFDDDPYNQAEPQESPQAPAEPSNILPNGIFSRYRHLNQYPANIIQPGQNARPSMPQWPVAPQMGPPPLFTHTGDPRATLQNYPGYPYTITRPTIALRGRPRTVSAYVADPVDNIQYYPTPVPGMSPRPGLSSGPGRNLVPEMNTLPGMSLLPTISPITGMSVYEPQQLGYPSYLGPQMVSTEYLGQPSEGYYIQPSANPVEPVFGQRQSSSYTNANEDLALNLSNRTRKKRKPAARKNPAPKKTATVAKKTSKYSKKHTKIVPSAIPPSEEAVDALGLYEFSDMNSDMTNVDIMLPHFPSSSKRVLFSDRIAKCCKLHDVVAEKKLGNFLSNCLDVMTGATLLEMQRRQACKQDPKKTDSDVPQQQHQILRVDFGEENYGDGNIIAMESDDVGELLNANGCILANGTINSAELGKNVLLNVNNFSELQTVEQTSNIPSDNNAIAKNTENDGENQNVGNKNNSQSQQSLTKEPIKQNEDVPEKKKSKKKNNSDKKRDQNKNKNEQAKKQASEDNEKKKSTEQGKLCDGSSNQVEGENTAQQNLPSVSLPQGQHLDQVRNDQTIKNEDEENEQQSNRSNTNPFIEDNYGLARQVVEEAILKITNERGVPDSASSVADQDFEFTEHRVRAFECKTCALFFIDNKRFMIHFKWHHNYLNNHMTVLRRRQEGRSMLQLDDSSAQASNDGNDRNQRPTSDKGPRRRRNIERTCDMCNKMYPNFKTLMKHKRQIHTATKVFNCVLCPKAFKFARSLQKHADTHLEKKHPCSQCYKKFGSQLLLSIHMKTHERKVKKFQCSYCPKAYYDSHALGAHERTHTNERPFSCDICHTSFGTTSGLKRHKKVSHNPSKPFECPDCHRSFSTLNIRDRHQVRFHGAPELLRFPCPLCPSRFITNRDLGRHSRTIHNICRRRNK